MLQFCKEDTANFSFQIQTEGGYLLKEKKLTNLTNLTKSTLACPNKHGPSMFHVWFKYGSLVEVWLKFG